MRVKCSAYQNGWISRTILRISLCVAAGASVIPLTNVADGNRAQQKPRTALPALASCLPRNVRLDEVAEYGFNGAGDVTVGEKLKELKARCAGRRVVSDRVARSRPREVHFFRKLCEGYPAPNYVEAQAEEKRKIEELRARYAVIVIGCDPRIPRAPTPTINQPMKDPF